MPTPKARKSQLAASEVLLELFANLEEAADKADIRYVMALLLVRRRILRLEETETDADGQECWCSTARATNPHRVRSVMPDEQRTAEIKPN
jgi:hypothetical protein